MFKLNRMTDYAIVVLGALARRQGEILATGQLSELTGLSQPTIAKVAKALVAAGLLDTQRGVNGGYRLAHQATMISLVQIVEAMEGPIAVNDCVEDAPDPCMVGTCCSVSRYWNRVNQVLKDALTVVFLRDLIDPAQLFTPADQAQTSEHKMPSTQRRELLC